VACGVGSGSVGVLVATGSTGRSMRSVGAAAGASITGCPAAASVPGALTSAEYSRTSRPWPQSTSIRKFTAATSTGVRLVTRTTGRPASSSAMVKSSSLTRPSGRGRPTRSNVTGDARRARSCSSSPGSLEMTGISASSGWPGCDLTLISPRPSARAALLSNASPSPIMPARWSLAARGLCFGFTAFPKFSRPRL